LQTLLDVLEGSERTRGGHSYLERAFLEVVDDLGLPRPLTQQVLARRDQRLIRVDFHFPRTNVVVEVLGYRFHRSSAQMQTDAERLNALVLAGFRPFQFTYEDVVGRSDRMCRSLIGVLS
jgi:very-short-patch-repair endonuclease